MPGNNTHLWEESWDDDDTSEDFSAQLKYVDTFIKISDAMRSEAPRKSMECQAVFEY